MRIQEWTPQNLLTPTTSLKHPWMPLEAVPEHPQGSWTYWSSPGTSSRILNLLKQSRNILKDPELIEAVPEHPQGSIEWMHLLNFLQGLRAESRWSVTPGGWRVKHHLHSCVHVSNSELHSKKGRFNEATAAVMISNETKQRRRKKLLMSWKKCFIHFVC